MVLHLDSKGHPSNAWMTPLPKLCLPENVKDTQPYVGLLTKLLDVCWPQSQSLLNTFCRKIKKMQYFIVVVFSFFSEKNLVLFARYGA